MRRTAIQPNQGNSGTAKDQAGAVLCLRHDRRGRGSVIEDRHGQIDGIRAGVSRSELRCEAEDQDCQGTDSRFSLRDSLKNAAKMRQNGGCLKAFGVTQSTNVGDELKLAARESYSRR